MSALSPEVQLGAMGWASLEWLGDRSFGDTEAIVDLRWVFTYLG
jgi:hypothetical protein